MQQIDPAQLHTILVEYYDLSDLRQMCLHLGIDYEDISGSSKSNKALSLIMYMQRRRQLDELAAYVIKTRPFITPDMLAPHTKMGGDTSYSYHGGDGSEGIRFDNLEETAPPIKKTAVSKDLRLDADFPAQVQPDRSFMLHGDDDSEGIRLGDLEETAPPIKETAVSKDLRLDAAFPAQVQPDRSFMIAIAIRQSDSPTLQKEELDQTTSGDVRVEWAAGADSAALRIHISAPDCDTHGQDEYTFRLRKGKDSPVFYFQLTPKTTGRIGIVVTVYQEQEGLLGMTRLHTAVQKHISGTVEMSTQSHPIVINHYHGDTYNFSGEFNGANVNVRSTLKDVNQTINTLPRANDADKAELQQQIAQLNRVLQEAPDDKKEAADAVAKYAKTLVDAANSDTPNKMRMEITGNSLKQAAENLAGIVPDVVKIAGAIVAGILRLS